MGKNNFIHGITENLITTMKTQRIKRYLIVIPLLGFSGSGDAVPYPNQFPGIWGDDIDGNGLFNPVNFTLHLMCTPLALAVPAAYYNSAI